jgi:hypothetical protein
MLSISAVGRIALGENDAKAITARKLVPPATETAVRALALEAETMEVRAADDFERTLEAGGLLSWTSAITKLSRA